MSTEKDQIQPDSESVDKLVDETNGDANDDAKPVETKASMSQSADASSQEPVANRRAPESNLGLQTPVQYLKGIGPKRAELLERLGLTSVQSLLFNFPRDYQELAQATELAELQEDTEATIAGVVTNYGARTTRRRLHLVTATLDVQGEPVKAVWFNQPFLYRRFVEEGRVLISGKPKQRAGMWEFSNPKLITLRDDEALPDGEIVPVYRLTEGLQAFHLRTIVQQALAQFADCVLEVLPSEFRQQHELWGIREALKGIHFPVDQEDLERARRRLVFQELLVLQLGLAMRRQRLESKQKAPRLSVDAKIDARICRLFPFDLTEAQRTAIDEITQDLGRAVPMNRLLQGDVGAGKTVVAFYAMLVATAHKKQAVLMAPTEILARQHAKNLTSLLMDSRVRVECLTGSVSAAQRRTLLDDLTAGEIDLLVGTHALISDDVKFRDLAVVVIDEQHKFGVQQRAVLRKAGRDPHYLVMTATPIPRSVTMTAFGDLDISSLREGPPNRRKVHTYLGTDESRAEWWEFFRSKMNEGRQGYVIAPLVEESERSDLASVNSVFEELANGPLNGYRVGLLHGRQSSEEKAAAMYDFATGELQVLVSTTVLEVGVDVANATVMTIESGEQFGLSQLHQLRGRIGRGGHPGFVCVFADPTQPEAYQRLEAFKKSNDGFELAELDFDLRGPGDLFGVRQHGMPPMRVADLRRDRSLVLEARNAARELLEEFPDLVGEDLSLLRKQVLNRYGAVLDLGDVG